MQQVTHTEYSRARLRRVYPPTRGSRAGIRVCRVCVPLTRSFSLRDLTRPHLHFQAYISVRTPYLVAARLKLDGHSRIQFGIIGRSRFPPCRRGFGYRHALARCGITVRIR